MHLRLLIQTEHFSCIQPYSIRLFNLICGLFHIFSIISTNILVFYTLILEIAYPVTRNRLSQLRQFPFLVRIIVMTDTENKTPAKKKGGARPGAGRKPLIGAKTTTVILTEDLLIQLKRLGGSSWIRSQIAATTKPSPTKIADDVFNSLPIPAEEISVEKAPDNSMDQKNTSKIYCFRERFSTGSRKLGFRFDGFYSPERGGAGSFRHSRLCVKRAKIAPRAFL